MQGRKIYMDFLRVIAIFMVLFNHTSVKGYALFTVALESPLFGGYLFLSIFIKIAVPLYFMISGALLLKKNEPLGYVIKNRFLKYTIILFICSFLIYLYLIKGEIYNFSIRDFIRIVYSSNMTPGYWYLYAYLAYILMLPLLRSMVKVMKNYHFIYLIIVFFAFQCLKIIQFMVWNGAVTLNVDFSVFIMADNIFYPLMGYFLENRLPSKYYNKKNTLLLVAGSVITIVIVCCLTVYRSNMLGEWNEASSQFFFRFLIFIPTLTVFFGSKYYFENYHVNEKMAGVITTLSTCTFGIYLFELIYRALTEKIYWVLVPYLHSLLSCLIWILCACLLGCIITLLLKKIPFIRNFI